MRGYGSKRFFATRTWQSCCQSMVSLRFPINERLIPTHVVTLMFVSRSRNKVTS